jgi:antitoxin (DNA-binding transcriptional repressor) of toxin-antitoxin stability system
MRTFSIMEVQHNLSKVLSVVDTGQSVGITRRKHLVARIVPAREAVVAWPNFTDRAAKIWGGPWQGVPSQSLLDESRGSA